MAETALSGRIHAHPSRLVHSQVLKPQFDYEKKHLLAHYLDVERAQLLEYVRLGLVSSGEAAAIAAALDSLTPRALVPDPTVNTSDMALAIEKAVESRLDRPVPGWHADRSRNDYQATAQRMFARGELCRLGVALLAFGTKVLRAAEGLENLPMLGYTHYQAAQIVSPAFHLSALVEEVLAAGGRLEAVYDEINVCPLGAGAMAGQELAWDLGAMAARLGFAEPLRHALVAVSSRNWTLRLGAELAILGLVVGRFVTDLMHWGSSDCAFIDLPDELSGISSAMPQKKNFPVLERVRGRTAHLGAFFVDFLLAQRNTPYTNLVEVSKEAGKYLLTAFETACSTLALLGAVLERMRFREDRLRTAASREYCGGFTLANYLAFRAGLPYRQAQVVAGAYVAAALERGLDPAHPDPGLLRDVAQVRGIAVDVAARDLARILAPETGLAAKRTPGSTNPAAVAALLSRQAEEVREARRRWRARQNGLAAASRRLRAEVDALAGEPGAGGGEAAAVGKRSGPEGVGRP